jgi:large subunit ribosomal protein L4
VHGPKPRDYSQRTPKKMKAAALRCALSDRARNGRLHVIEAFSVDAPSTRAAKNAIKAVSERRNVLVVLGREETNAWLSLRNLAEVHLLHADQLNTYDVLVSDDVIFTRAGYDAFVAGPKKASADTEGSEV